MISSITWGHLWCLNHLKSSGNLHVYKHTPDVLTLRNLWFAQLKVLCIPCDFRNKYRLFPYKALSMVFIMETLGVYCEELLEF